MVVLLLQWMVSTRGEKKAVRLETMRSKGRLASNVGSLEERRAWRWARAGASGSVGKLRWGENEWAMDLG